MAKYRVTLRVSRTETVEADNPYQAAVLSSARHDGNAEVVDVHRAAGRPATKKGAKKGAKKVAKKRRPLSPEARARLAQNLVKARAARAAKRKAVAKKAPAKKTVKKARKATKKAPAKKKTVKRG